jgi:hypothetical protein
MFSDGRTFDQDDGSATDPTSQVPQVQRLPHLLRQIRPIIEADRAREFLALAQFLAKALPAATSPDRRPLTTKEAAEYLKVCPKTFMKRYAPLLSPIQTAGHTPQRRHRRWSRQQVERLASGAAIGNVRHEPSQEDVEFVRRQMEKRLE